MADKGPVKRMTVRLPVELYAEVERAAGEDDRALHGQILALIRRGLAARARERRAKATR